MMRGIANRLAKLEARQPGQLSEALLAWLGFREQPVLTHDEWVLREAERERLSADPGSVDMSGWSESAKRQWLGYPSGQVSY